VPSGQRSGPRLLPVRVKPENGRGTIRVSLANGASIELCGDVDPLHWRALLESVVSI